MIGVNDVFRDMQFLINYLHIDDWNSLACASFHRLQAEFLFFFLILWMLLVIYYVIFLIICSLFVAFLFIWL